MENTLTTMQPALDNSRFANASNLEDKSYPVINTDSLVSYAKNGREENEEVRAKNEFSPYPQP
jgi:hypothetical protein